VNKTADINNSPGDWQSTGEEKFAESARGSAILQSPGKDAVRNRITRGSQRDRRIVFTEKKK